MRNLLMLFLCSAAQITIAQTFDSLITKSYAEYQQKRYVESALTIEKAITAGASDPIVYYNAACFFALSGRQGKAWYYLDKSVAAGYHDAHHMQTDSDLVSLWTDIKWKPFIEKIQSSPSMTPEDREPMIDDLNNLASYAYQYKIRPASMGGGDGSYIGCRFPEKWASTQNGTYRLTHAAQGEMEILGTSLDGRGTITVTVSSDGRIQNWSFSGKFSTSSK